MDEVEELVKTWGTTDPFAIINFLDCHLIFENLRQGTLGINVISENEDTVIINECIPSQLKTYVAAHELGHIVSGVSQSTTILREKYFGFNIPGIEAKANRFAFNLLLYDLDYDFESESINLYTVLHYFHLPDNMIRFITPLPIKSGGD
ncbi:ImmA/IrrE family metallo-endopeptidase [Bombilactobacillus folatiphilus]|uniref:ImmA/IrrE family metallo-endopeptidase n=1 Tax=Bombilactobacillus folatiphilus TaxID=2923362 RepID=A0ABY4PA79_9LACO|nr:ImmA/IrrE family metallo-endopeptidase [Bombilactobacillus folatiphilus]UQS82577.1 ImmA/IrrE family metallo-endopeptidase [Bombilactobacillus folatiphilus]